MMEGTTTTTTTSDNTSAGAAAAAAINPAAAKARKWMGQFTQTAAQTMQDLTARKYTLPDKNVASQLLMYRQLLHTKCRPGLKLSREYQGTPAQQAVKHMPWWSEGCEETKKMVIAYDNLIRRLWLHGAIFPYGDQQENQETLLNEEGMPPIPHDYWVHRLGFQQTDPVTDFRSGGVLSLAMMVFMTESCPDTFRRFCRPDGDASVLPFGITSINITDMISKFLMLAKSVDRMDALLSQKPFWRMFADPNALTACQELSMDMLADVVVEVQEERKAKGEPAVTVFDFSMILERTEKRVQYDLLGAGPKSVKELREIHARLKSKYKQQLQQRLQPQPEMKDQVMHHATELAAGATTLAGNLVNKIKTPGFNPLRKNSSPTNASNVTSPATETKNATTATAAGAAETADANADTEEWAGTDIQAATDAVSNFSIGDEDDDDDL